MCRKYFMISQTLNSSVFMGKSVLSSNNHDCKETIFLQNWLIKLNCYPDSSYIPFPLLNFSLHSAIYITLISNNNLKHRSWPAPLMAMLQEAARSSFALSMQLHNIQKCTIYVHISTSQWGPLTWLADICCGQRECSCTETTRRTSRRNLQSRITTSRSDVE